MVKLRTDFFLVGASARPRSQQHALFQTRVQLHPFGKDSHFFQCESPALLFIARADFEISDEVVDIPFMSRGVCPERKSPLELTLRSFEIPFGLRGIDDFADMKCLEKSGVLLKPAPECGDRTQAVVDENQRDLRMC